MNHAAGLAGYGSSSYIDGVILRDDHEDDWTEAADSTMERRVYYCQNWRADVIAILAENGRIVEKAWYEPYGTPHGMSPADFSGTSDDTNDHYLVPDGDADADDSFVYLDLFGLSAGLSDMTGSSDPGDGEYGRPNGTVDSDDYFYYLDQYSVAASLGRNVLSAGHDGATASHGAGNLRNRKGLAGYEWDPHVRRYHVRNRVLYPETGRWTRRDPLGYVDGMGLHEFQSGSPVSHVDSHGLCVGGCGGQPGNGNSGVGRSARPPGLTTCQLAKMAAATCLLGDPRTNYLWNKALKSCASLNISCSDDPGCGNGAPAHYCCGRTEIVLCASAFLASPDKCNIVKQELVHADDFCTGHVPCDAAADKGCGNFGTSPNRPEWNECIWRIYGEFRSVIIAGTCCESYDCSLKDDPTAPGGVRYYNCILELMSGYFNGSGVCVAEWSEWANSTATRAMIKALSAEACGCDVNQE